MLRVQRLHLSHYSVHDEGLDGGDMALWVVNSDEDVFIVRIRLLLILPQSVLVDHGARRVGHGVSIRQGGVLDQQEESDI